MMDGGVRGRSKGVQLLCSDEADGLKKVEEGAVAPPRACRVIR